MTEEFIMRPQYDKLLRGTDELPIGLYQLHQAKAEQLCRLHYSPGSVKAVKLNLKLLARHGFVQADRMLPGVVSSPYYYMMGLEGMNYLRSLGYDIDESWRQDNELRSWVFLKHDLEALDVVISAVLLSRSHPAYTLDHFKTGRELKRQPYQASWVNEHGRQTYKVIPDALLEFGYTRPDGQHLRMPLLLEYDRDSHKQLRFRQKIRAYVMLIKTESYKQLFQTTTLTIAYVTSQGQERFNDMLKWTRAELEGEPPYVRQAFCFANFTPPITPDIWLSNEWRTPDDQALALLAA